MNARSDDYENHVDHDKLVEEDSKQRENMKIIDFKRRDFEDQEGIQEEVEEDN
jgi:hypothetical protein